MIGDNWHLDAQDVKSTILIPNYKVFGPKAHSKSLTSYYLTSARAGQVPVITVKRSVIDNIYAETGVTEDHMLPTRQGVEITLTFSGIHMEDTGVMVPIQAKQSYVLPLALDHDDEEMNSILQSLQGVLSGMCLSNNGSDVPDIMQIVKGVTDLKETARESEPATT
jgi:hypothetical protein